jgi:glycosyltransferase involved in cell wall biosynthesis
MQANRSLSILVVNYEYPPVGGGGGFICRNVVEELAKLGHNITVVTSHFGNLPRRERNNNVHILRIPVLMRTRQDVATLPSLLSYVPFCIMKATNLFRRNHFDLISTHFAIPSGPAGHHLSHKYGIPNVLSIYGGDIFDPTKSISPHKTFGLKQTVRKMLNGADRVISDSSDIKDYAIKYYGIERRIDVIPPGVSPYTGPSRSRVELGLPENEVILITLGRLVKRKNNQELLDVFDRVRRCAPCHLMIMGEGPDRSHLEKKISELGLHDCVTLTGRVGEEKFQYMAASDVYVSTATHEGFGLVFLEAMESGLPVISYDNGGQVDFLKYGKTGFLVSLGDRDAFSLRLKELILSERMRKEMSLYNKSYIRNFYTHECAKKYLSIFYEAIHK